MDKGKAALTIGKLFATAIALSIILMAATLIEGLQASLKFAVWTMEQLNQSAEMPVEIKAIGPVLEIPIAPEIEIEFNNFPIKFPVNANLWMIAELPRDYLNVKSLKVWAKDRQIKGYGKMVKAELIKAVGR